MFSGDKPIFMIKIDQINTSSCPVCGKDRVYKSRYNLAKCKDKPCKSCSNSIKAGGSGKLFDSNGNRLCTGCKEFLPISSYYLKANSKLGTTLCKKCSNKATKEYVKTIYRYSKYSITEQEFDQKLLEQCNCCGICKQEFKSKKEIKIDHCHRTNEFRGLLCHHCNVGIGHFKDSIQLLNNSIKYLKKWT